MREFNAKTQVSKLNMARLALTESFTLDELRQQLKAYKFLTSKRFINSLILFDALSQVKDGMYTFCSKPVYYKRLDVAYRHYYSKYYLKDVTWRFLEDNSSKIKKYLCSIEGKWRPIYFNPIKNYLL